jgi:hypothetical protein
LGTWPPSRGRARRSRDGAGGSLDWLVTPGEASVRGGIIGLPSGRPFYRPVLGLVTGPQSRSARSRGSFAYVMPPAGDVEIVSPASVHRDRVEKLAEYEQGGAPEYWLVDPDRQQVELRVLGPEGRHRLVFAGSDGLCTCARSCPSSPGTTTPSAPTEPWRCRRPTQRSVPRSVGSGRAPCWAG